MPPARAPIASALTASVPRRNPLSTMTGIRPFTAAMISGSASMAWRRVKLEPDRRAARPGHAFHGIVRGRRQDLQMIAGTRRLGDGHLAVGMEELVAAG